MSSRFHEIHFLEKGLGNVILNVSIIVTAVHSHGDKHSYVALV